MESMQIQTYTIQGRAEMLEPINDESGQANEGDSSESIEAKNAKEKARREEELEQMLSILNEDSVSMSKEVEQKLKGLLPPFFDVQAEFRFASGSLIVTGTVAILSWAGSVALKAASQELEAQLKDVVKIVVQKAMASFVSKHDLSAKVAPTDMRVLPLSRPTQAKTSEQAMVGKSEASADDTKPNTKPAPVAIPTWLIALLVFLTFAVTLLVADRFLEVSLKTLG